MRLAEWIDRLQAQTSLDVKDVVDFATAEREHRRDTSYVMYSADDARPNDVTGVVRQQHSIGVDVVSAITNFRGSRGSEGIDEIERVRDQVLDALVGWAPPSAGGDPVTYRRGRLLRVARRTIWWQDSFEVFEYRTSTLRD